MNSLKDLLLSSEMYKKHKRSEFGIGLFFIVMGLFLLCVVILDPSGINTDSLLIPIFAALTMLLPGILMFKRALTKTIYFIAKGTLIRYKKRIHTATKTSKRMRNRTYYEYDIDITEDEVLCGVADTFYRKRHEIGTEVIVWQETKNSPPLFLKIQDVNK